MTTTPQPQLYAIYDADGSLQGELAYVLGKVLSTRSCELCDISHGWHPLGKKQWREASCSTWNINWIHRDEQPAALQRLTEGRLPAVVLMGDQPRILLTRDDLAACRGDYTTFEQLLTQRLESLSTRSNPDEVSQANRVQPK